MVIGLATDIAAHAPRDKAVRPDRRIARPLRAGDGKMGLRPEGVERNQRLRAAFKFAPALRQRA
jgi:hypothetical protein